ncbi:UNVERIFIED_CONTAM: hypothetical protein K2H54_044626 [Gekko kuhli]
MGRQLVVKLPVQNFTAIVGEVRDPLFSYILIALKGSKKLNLSVHSVGRIPGGYVTNHIYTWVDPHGRSVSPPTGLPQHQSSTLRKDGDKRSHLQLLQEGDEKKVSAVGGEEIWLCCAVYKK